MIIVLHDSISAKLVIREASDVVVEGSNIYWNNRSDSLQGVNLNVLVLPDDFSVEEGTPITDDMRAADLTPQSVSIETKVDSLENTVNKNLEQRISTLEQQVVNLLNRIAALESGSST
jgi:hypothetical protein